MAIILTTLTIFLICCKSTENIIGYKFPTLEETERIIDKSGNVTSLNKDGEIVFYFDAEKDLVTIPYWYWVKIINYGINTGGIVEK